jgi:hypothetical protein
MLSRESYTTTMAEKIAQMKNQSTELLARHNLNYQNVGWDDVSRAFNSSIGSNISDWSFMLKDGITLPFIRSPNYTDKTLTISAKDMAIIVGNERPGGNLNAITFQNYLENYGKYTPSVPDSVDLSAGPDELVSIRFIGVIVPENADGSQEVVPTAYNYQTTSDENPKNILGASFHMGVGTTSDGAGKKKVYLVQTASEESSGAKLGEDLVTDQEDSLSQYSSLQEDTWFKITNEACETEEQKKAVATVLGTRSTGSPARNRVQCFQIPRIQDPPKQIFRSWNSYDDECAKCAGAMCLESDSGFRSMSTGNVSHGSGAGKHTKIKMTYNRDKTQNVTVTFAYYFTTKDCNLTEKDINSIADTLEQSYNDIKAKWVGSLVTGNKNTSIAGTQEEPPIKLPSLTSKDTATFKHKIKHFPKSTADVQVFPT